MIRADAGPATGCMPKVIARLVRLWSVRGSTDPAGPHRWVVLSFIASTRVMLVAAGQLEDASDAVGYSTESATLACGVVAAAGGAATGADMVVCVCVCARVCA